MKLRLTKRELRLLQQILPELEEKELPEHPQDDKRKKKSKGSDKDDTLPVFAE